MLKISGKEKILIVRLTALGDCIHTIPLACAIKKEYPDIFIGWAVSEKCKDIILDNPVIDKVHIIPKNDSKEYANVMSNIRKEKYTIAIDSQELFKSAIISFSSNAKFKLAHDKSRELAHLFSNVKLPVVPLFDTSRHVMERNLDFARFLGINNPEVHYSLPLTLNDDRTYVLDLLKNIDATKKNVIIAPSTTWKSKFWTINAWAEVLQNINNHVNIILSGSNSDKDYIEDILKCAGEINVINLVGKTNLLQLLELFRNADVVITPDSGSSHLAAAVEKPVIISVCGPTSNVRNGAYGYNHINLTSDLNCQPCYKKVCKFSDNNSICMEQLTPDIVIEKLKSVLRR